MDELQLAHAREGSTILAALDVNPRHGLSREEARLRLERHGPNVLTPRRRRGPVLRFLLQFHQPLIYILLAAVVVTSLLSEWADAIVIFGVVLVNAIIGFVQESKALGAIDALAKTLLTEANVLREGRRLRLPTAQLVPGDIVLLASGDKVPADLRLIEAKDLQLDESALTGESLPVEKSIEPSPEVTALGDRRSMAYASTMVTRGQARGVVVATADATEVGRISTLLSTAEDLKTPLTLRIEEFSRMLLMAILLLAGLTFGLGLLRGKEAFEMFMTAVALTVGAIPEGLPAAVTIMLAMGVHRMAKRRAIIRKLPAVETLGSTTVICSDKTGTLTQNQMTTLAIHAGRERFRVTGVGYHPEGRIETLGGAAATLELPALARCLRIGLLANDSQLVEREQTWAVEGDPTEGALLAVARKAGLDPLSEEQTFPRLDTVAFESEHQYMATLHATPAGERLAMVKGSVEAILSRASAEMSSDGNPSELDAPAVHAAVEEMARGGLRVLALAYKEMAPTQETLSHDDLRAGLVFVGLQGMLDPPREEAKAAIRMCHQAGIAVKMITGDHAVTAATIAAELALQGKERDGRLLALTGLELERLSDAELEQAAAEVAVFARVSPEQKLRLVRALQRRGHVAAMTGDGVNDAPALRQANIGVAMGITGTEVAKDAADMVLTDDNFASIEAAVEEGRSVFENLTKFIVWTLPTNVGEGLIVLISGLLTSTVPITPVQILWVNMTTAVLLGLTLAFEPMEGEVMRRPPRAADHPILDRPLILRTLFVGVLLVIGGLGLFELMLHQGLSEVAARTVTVNTIVMGELFYLFNCRSLERPLSSSGFFGNPWIFVGVALTLLLQIAFTHAPLMNRWFGTAPIPLAAWGWSAMAGLAIFLLVTFEKRLRFRALGRRGAALSAPR